MNPNHLGASHEYNLIGHEADNVTFYNTCSDRQKDRKHFLLERFVGFLSESWLKANFSTLRRMVTFTCMHMYTSTATKIFNFNTRIETLIPQSTRHAIIQFY